MNSNILSVIAVAISAISLGISFYNLHQDRAHLKTESKFINRGSSTGSSILVTLKNSGRRPIIVRAWGYQDKSKYWRSFPLGEPNQGITLGEKSFYEFNIELDNIHDYVYGMKNKLVSIWVEDSLNNRHPIKNAIRLTEKFRNLIYSLKDF